MELDIGGNWVLISSMYCRKAAQTNRGRRRMDTVRLVNGMEKIVETVTKTLQDARANGKNGQSSQKRRD
jgi:hypothetical protein